MDQIGFVYFVYKVFFCILYGTMITGMTNMICVFQLQADRM